jgi:hypothetical protein
MLVSSTDLAQRDEFRRVSNQCLFVSHRANILCENKRSRGVIEAFPLAMSANNASDESQPNRVVISCTHDSALTSALKPHKDLRNDLFN